MVELRLFQVDSFTRQPFTGNPAGVVLGGEELTEAQMQAIARELNNSETAFILRSDAPDHDIQIRFFTPTQEVPSCGHATLASHYVRAKLLNAEPGYVRHKIKAGLLGAEIQKRHGDYFVVNTQSAPSLSPPYGKRKRAEVLDALGLLERDLPEGLPVQQIDTGNSKVMVPIISRELLNRLKPDMEKLTEFHEREPNGGYFVFTLSNPDPGITAHSRMFAPNIGIPEDPVTGNGNGPLGAYLVANRMTIVRDGEFAMRGRQGEVAGRSGNVDVWVEVRDGLPKRVRIGGYATIVFEARLTI